MLNCRLIYGRRSLFPPGGSGFLFLSMPAGFRSDSGVIFILSNFGAFGAEAPSKKSAGSDDDADDETDVLDDDDDEEVD